MARFVLHPGYYINSDGVEQFIGGPRLAASHNVDLRSCEYGDMPEYKELEGDIHLYPDPTGTYYRSKVYFE